MIEKGRRTLANPGSVLRTRSRPKAGWVWLVSSEPLSGSVVADRGGLPDRRVQGSGLWGRRWSRGWRSWRGGRPARERIFELRGQTEELAEQLTEKEDVVSRLEITRETMEHARLYPRPDQASYCLTA
ncbi:hypothetical protein GCM10012286_80500 [Streptomyces lasiicapitis]|uniref:Uncharacterized protein n=1 Tax=Streptomyces lasiicapitis TaxID=1923961 RepID=A0ABQ2MWN7_9ACTN|nr:hypothetical protein GCM10012286_80500 [Streptomyces lasiicapitis]